MQSAYKFLFHLRVEYAFHSRLFVSSLLLLLTVSYVRLKPNKVNSEAKMFLWTTSNFAFSTVFRGVVGRVYSCSPFICSLLSILSDIVLPATFKGTLSSERRGESITVLGSKCLRSSCVWFISQRGRGFHGEAVAGGGCWWTANRLTLWLVRFYATIYSGRDVKVCIFVCERDRDLETQGTSLACSFDSMV